MIGSKVIVLITLLIFIVQCSQCSKTIDTSDQIVVYIPKAPPALLFYQSQTTMRNLKLEVYRNLSTEVFPHIIQGVNGLFVIPVNSAAALYNKGRPVQLITILSSGMLHLICKKSSIVTMENLQGKTVYIPAQGASPDLIARYIFKKLRLNPKILYGNAPVIAKLLLSNKIECAVLPEPLATTTLFKGKNRGIQKVINFRSQWLELYPQSSGLPQVALVGNQEYIKDNLAMITTLLNTLQKSAELVQSDYSIAADIYQNQIGFPIVDGAINETISSMHLVVQSPSAIKSDIELYLTALLEIDPRSVGGKLPENDFYAF